MLMAQIRAVALLAAAVHVAGSTTRLATLPPDVNPFVRSRVASRAALQHVASDVADAVKRALADGVQLLEVEFPPLLGAKTQFDDFSNIEVLDANRDFALELVPRLGMGSELWVCLLDEKERELALEAYPGAAYQSATLLSLEAAAKACSGRAAATWLESAIGGMMGKGETDAAAGAAAAADKAACRLVVQPCEEGRVNDWLNMELLATGAGEGIPIICQNGYLDKQRSGYYARWQFPEIGRCYDDFLSGFDAVYYLRPLQSKGRVGWLLRTYGQPWQLFSQERDEARQLAEYDTRPSFQQLAERLVAG